MDDLIEALRIFAKYQAKCYSPTHCEHDVFMVMDVGKTVPSEEDRARLDSLSFTWLTEFKCWGSFRFGSA
jgi:hypothetical protein